MERTTTTTLVIYCDGSGHGGWAFVVPSHKLAVCGNGAKNGESEAVKQALSWAEEQGVLPVIISDSTQALQIDAKASLEWQPRNSNHYLLLAHKLASMNFGHKTFRM